MRKAFLLLAAIVLLNIAVHQPAPAFAAYRITSSATWDGTYANRLKPQTDDYKYTHGDEASLIYNLPWPFTFYGQTYSQNSPITIDTNGNIWFTATGSAHSFSLANSGRGPVIAAWNNDLSSYFHGGVFVQRKTNPDRVVVEWWTPTYTDEGEQRMNNFEAVLFPNGNIRFDYKTFDTSNGRDYGSGISDGAGNSLSLAQVPTLAGHSYTFTELPPFLSVFFSGSGEGTVTSTPAGLNCTADCSASFPPGTGVSLHAEPSQYSLFTGWTNGVCSGTGDCSLTMDGDPYATAQFTRDTAHYVRIDGGSTGYYPSIQAAYNAASNDDTVKLWALTYSEALLCNRPISITFRGGYDSGYTGIVGEIVLNGTLTISDGTVIADGLSIR